MSEQNSDCGIRVVGLARSFGKVAAVSDVSFDARPGRVTALVGPNGSGKTTLLLMLATLLVPERGSIRIDGHDPVTESREVRSLLGWMPDVLGSWAALTVRATLELTGQLYGASRNAASVRARELIELVDLVEFSERPTRVLSRGQKQRLSLARALVHDPRVLLLDEPASGLDPGARVALRELVRRLAGEGRTILIASHVLSELDEIADDAVFLERGATVTEERVTAAQSKPREWRIRTLDPDSLAAALARESMTPRSTSDPAETLIALPGERAAAALLGRLIAEGVPVTEYAPSVGDLEQTFLDLNGGGAR
ncbi:MAG: ABC transporter ATP-binding protein [Acidobacteria bacterium]|nr:ABC transporter ATP-binding protein [Acidobacteriota bacterium]